jgi:hypothetical protein
MDDQPLVLSRSFGDFRGWDELLIWMKVLCGTGQPFSQIWQSGGLELRIGHNGVVAIARTEAITHLHEPLNCSSAWFFIYELSGTTKLRELPNYQHQRNTKEMPIHKMLSFPT